MVDAGFRVQYHAVDYCKSINAKLPLPKSKEEFDEFRRIMDFYVWIGIMDTSVSGNKSNWRDLEGNLIENAYVNLRVKNLTVFSFCLKTEPA